ncbi:FAD-dependent oxidoreductase [Candidatus Puniceispirillum marinum]|uniref:Amino oxidase n=1 Tax=Puniceispirillum marinum (strain IMCC1322) TaxID=488538 RepID=D5BMG5_PUNMI|nr:FAD/NAD(P)-binding protein [Candidatus Puniceispirillum marinum]ADE40008.1 amino oxidase [Candidatus Puniceispirillum marinum IMCC1322]
MKKDIHSAVSEPVDAEVENRTFTRREFLEGSSVALSAVILSQAGWLGQATDAKALENILYETEASLYFRDRLPDYQTPFTNSSASLSSLFDWNFPALIKSATGDGFFGTEGMPSNFSSHTTVPEKYNNLPVAIIGAGASGLVVGYELMKLGLEPHFYEMQTQTSATGQMYSRPNGRAYSWDFGGNGVKAGAAAGWYTNDTLTPNSVKPSYNRNVHSYGRRIAELGAMRFPATHLTLRTYTDTIFASDYYYGDSGISGSWVPFRDPGLYHGTNPPMTDRGGVTRPGGNDTIIFDTAYYTKGIFKNRKSANPPHPGGYSEFDRVRSGTTLANSNAAVLNLSQKYFDLLFGDLDPSKPYQGVLTTILQLYSEYTKDQSPANAKAIADEWTRLIDTYDSKSLGEVLQEAGWDSLPAYEDEWGDLNLSLAEMFGEIGTGTGPFAMFYYSSFMELLRIALQAADSNQDYFRGGVAYMLQPFLTNFTKTKLSGGALTCLWNETKGSVVVDKVVSVKKQATGGVLITTQDSSGVTTDRSYAAAVVTASPAAIRAMDMFPEPDQFLPSRTVSYFKRIRINNNSKIAINFPNIKGESSSAAFWMRRIDDNDTNPNNDLIVTTLTDKTIRQIYTFDNYHWATSYNDTTIGDLSKSGTLMLNYGWDYNAQSWTASDTDTAVRKAWNQMKSIYGFGTQYDNYLNWAIENEQTAFVVWEKIDGFNAAWRMAQPGRGTAYGDLKGKTYARLSELQTAQIFGMTSYNPETSQYTGLFIAGEATASPGLSGWIEGSLQTGLQAVAGIVKYLNEANPSVLAPKKPVTGKNFALQAHPGITPVSRENA